MDQPESIKTITIIGHGPSPKTKGWGRRIDENIVIRLKNPEWQDPKDYGVRLDYICSSTETLPIMLDYKRVPKEYWAMPKKGYWSSLTEKNFRQRAQAPLKIALDIHLKWNPVFLSITDSDCPNHSLGMASITYACEFLKPETIQLVGFDNMLNPDLEWYEKSNKGRWPSRHDWNAEHKMLPLVEKEYGVEIVGLR